MVSIALNRLRSFYRDSGNTAYCIVDGDLDHCRTVCDGDLALLEKPTDLRNHRNQPMRNPRDRRNHPRFDLDLPVECQMSGSLKVFAGIAIDGSEGGLLIFSPKDMFTATRLKIIVFFPNRYELGSFEVIGEITRKEIQDTERRNGFQYGFKFIRILKEDHCKLKKLLSGLLAVEEASDRQGSELLLEA